MNFSVFSIAFALFLLMDPIGNIPLFLATLKDFPLRKQKKIILRELLISLFVIFCFYFMGNFFLELIHVSQHTILISGGIILFLIALKMIFPESLADKEQRTPKRKDPFVVPLAIPFVAGPAVLAAVMLYSQQREPTGIVSFAILLAWIATTGILFFSHLLHRLLGDKILTALERLMGLILTLISVQMFLQGISSYIECLKTSP